MTLLVFSDTHLNTRRMEYAVSQADPDIIVHLGDNIDDITRICEKMPAMIFHMVKGNCDTHSTGETEKILTVENIKILMTHGHEYHVKEGLSLLKKHAVKLEADLVLFGHTHGAAIVKEVNMTLMNPGQMEEHKERKRASYGVVTIVNREIECEIIYLPDDMFDW